MSVKTIHVKFTLTEDEVYAIELAVRKYITETKDSTLMKFLSDIGIIINEINS